MAFGSTLKDKAALAIAGVVVLYAVGGFLWFKAVTDKGSDWNRSRRDYAKAVQRYADERRLIAQRGMWNDAYEEEREKMPMFPEGEAVGTHWLNSMDSLANRYHVAISARMSGKEAEVGDVYELPVEVKSWEAGLEPLVEFLFALEHAPEAMFDVQAIDMRPSSHKGFLKGQFTLTCAYMRGDVAPDEDEEEAAPAENAEDGAKPKDLKEKDKEKKE